MRALKSRAKAARLPEMSCLMLGFGPSQHVNMTIDCLFYVRLRERYRESPDVMKRRDDFDLAG